MSAAEILAYWTPQRVAEAKPVDSVIKFSYSRELEEEADVRGNQQVTLVANVTSWPYQNVGKLLFKIGSSDTYLSAYYVGGTDVLTAAHGLVTTAGNATNLVFIPAMIDNTDVKGKNYGTFAITGGIGTAYVPDPAYDPKSPKAEHDIATVKVKDEGSNGMTIAQTLTNPIQYIVNQSNNSQTAWNTIGYPITDSQGRMCEISGTFVEMVSNTVTKKGSSPKGMSGGPWILNSNNGGNGVQAGNATKGDISPYFRNPWKFEALDVLCK